MRASVKLTLSYACQFLVRGQARIWSHILIPSILGGLALYLALDLYLFELQRYLLRPTDRIASLVLGIATAGLLLALFMHSVTVASIATVALARDTPGWRWYRPLRRAWRVYAAYLRFLLVCAFFILAVSVVQIIAVRLSEVAQPLARVVITGGLFVLAVRCGFLISAIACAKDYGPVVRESWRLSSGNSWKIAIVLLVCLLVGLSIEIAGEFAIQAVFRYPSLNHITQLTELAESFRQMLPGVLLVAGIAYFPSVVLLTSSAVAVYQQVVEQNASEELPRGAVS